MSTSDPSSCNQSLPPLVEEGLRLMNAGEYFAAHEALEAAWKAEPGPVRELYRGVLQVAVAYYHLTRGNYAGALKMLERCQPWLEPFPDRCQGIDVGQVKHDALAMEAELRRLGPGRLALLDPRLFRPVIWISSTTLTP